MSNSFNANFKVTADFAFLKLWKKLLSYTAGHKPFIADVFQPRRNLVKIGKYLPTVFDKGGIFFSLFEM